MPDAASQNPNPVPPLETPIFERFTVRSYELDSLGHLNNAVWFSWLEEATFASLARAGIPFASFASKGWVPVVVHAQLDFRAELRSGDDAIVEGFVLGYGRTSIRLGYRVIRAEDDVLAANGERVWVIVNNTREKIVVPDELRSVLGEPVEVADS